MAIPTRRSDAHPPIARRTLSGCGLKGKLLTLSRMPRALSSTLPVTVAVRRLAGTVAATCALLTGACASLRSPEPPVPSAGDSLFARRQLEETIAQLEQRELDENSPLRLRLERGTESLPDFSLAAARDNARFARAAVRRLDAVRYDALTEDDYVTLMTVRAYLAALAEDALFYWNDVTTLSRGRSPLNTIVDILHRLPLRTPEEARQYTRVLGTVASSIDTLRVVTLGRRARGVMLSRRALARTLPFLRALADSSVANPLALSPERDTALASDVKAILRQQSDSILRRDIARAMRRLTASLADDSVKKAPSEDGLWQYVGGKEYYRALVRRWTTMDVTPEQVYDAGLREVARIDSAMGAVRATLGFSGSARAFHDSLRATMQPAITDDAFMAQVRTALGRVQGHTDTLLQGLPVPKVVVRWEAQPPGTDRVLGTYHVPNGRGDAATFTPGDALLASGVPAAAVAATFFSLSPGRLLLFGAADPIRRLPFAPRYAAMNAYVDGWGVYAMDLAGEWGGYRSPAEEYGRLTIEMVIAARLVVDAGMHYFGWTRAQCTEYLARATALPAAEIEADLDRIGQDEPGESLAAGMGAREMRAYRRWLATELGSDFDARAFHRELLSLGPVPLPALGTHLEWWVWQERTRRRYGPTTVPRYRK